MSVHARACVYVWYARICECVCVCICKICMCVREWGGETIFLCLCNHSHTYTPPHSSSHTRTQFLAQFLQQCRHAHSTLATPGVFIVATARDTLHRRLLGPSAFAQRVVMPEALDQSQRLAVGWGGVCVCMCVYVCMFVYYVYVYMCICVRL